MNHFVYKSIILALLVLFSCRPENSSIFTNEPDGFRGYKWGTRFTDIPGLEIESSIAKEFGLSRYAATKQNEDLNMNGILLSEIIYFFDEHSLTGVLLRIPAGEQFESIKMYCFNQFGERRNLSKIKGNEEYKWDGEKTIIELRKTGYRDNEYGYLIFKSTSSETEQIPDSKLISLSDSTAPMELDLEITKRRQCMFETLLYGMPVVYGMTDNPLCKVLQIATDKTKPVFRHIKASKQVSPDYYFFSVFVEDYGDDENSETLYEENEIGLFENFEECNKLSQYALSNDIPIRQCRSWESRMKYEREILKMLDQ